MPSIVPEVSSLICPAADSLLVSGAAIAQSYMPIAIVRSRFSLMGILQSATVALLFATTAVAQSSTGFYVTSIQTGLRPLGIDRVPHATSGDTDDVVVANSGENSVSL